MKIKNFLLVYNWRESRLDHWRDVTGEIERDKLTANEARRLYAGYEKRFPHDEGYEVVLIGADSIDTIRKTHGHYFGEPGLEAFDELLDSGANER